MLIRMSDSEELFEAGEICSVTRNYYWGVTSVIVTLAVIVTVALSRKIVNLRRRSLSDGIYLQLVTDRLWENIKVGEVCVPQEQLFLTPPQNPLIIEINIILGWWRGEAWIRWGRELNASNVSTRREARPVILPQSLGVSKLLARELDSEQGSIKLARLVRQTGGLTSMIPLSAPMISGDGWSTIGENLREAETSFRRGRTERVSKGRKSSRGLGKNPRSGAALMTDEVDR